MRVTKAVSVIQTKQVIPIIDLSDDPQCNNNLSFNWQITFSPMYDTLNRFCILRTDFLSKCPSLLQRFHSTPLSFLPHTAKSKGIS